MARTEKEEITLYSFLLQKWLTVILHHVSVAQCVMKIRGFSARAVTPFLMCWTPCNIMVNYIASSQRETLNYMLPEIHCICSVILHLQWDLFFWTTASLSSFSQHIVPYTLFLLCIQLSLCFLYYQKTCRQEILATNTIHWLKSQHCACRTCFLISHFYLYSNFPTVNHPEMSHAIDLHQPVQKMKTIENDSASWLS